MSDERSMTYEAGDMALESFRDFEDGLYISNGSNFLVFKESYNFPPRFE